MEWRAQKRKHSATGKNIFDEALRWEHWWLEWIVERRVAFGGGGVAGGGGSGGWERGGWCLVAGVLLVVVVMVDG